MAVVRSPCLLDIEGAPVSGDPRVSPDSDHVAPAILMMEAPPASH